MMANRVLATAMRETPKELQHWPKHLQYVFDRSNPRSAKTVILSSYETFASRTLEIHPNPPDSKRKGKSYTSQWTSLIGTVIIDEGHRLRRSSTKLFDSIQQFQANVH